MEGCQDPLVVRYADAPGSTSAHMGSSTSTVLAAKFRPTSSVTKFPV